MVSSRTAKTAPLKRPELLAPAKDLETLKYVIAYGADAVYVGGPKFGLRSSASNFDISKIKEAVEFAHKRGKRVYVAANIFLRNDDIIPLAAYLYDLAQAEVDAVIVADPGLLLLIKEKNLPLCVHLSTQANVTNFMAARFFEDLGVKRIVLARELSLLEIEKIKKEIKAEIEVFVHGAMCIAHSGRCLISAYLAGREANRGECAQSCRWKYHMMEEERPGEFLPVFEDERGTYLFNSKDLSLARRIDSLISAGVDSFKIEGRMKSLHYVATVTKVYRTIIDECLKMGEDFVFNEAWEKELAKVSHRGYTEGFLSDEMSFPVAPVMEKTSSSSYIKTHDFLGVVIGSTDQLTRISVKNRFEIGDRVEVMTPSSLFEFSLQSMFDASAGGQMQVANPNQIVDIDFGYALSPYAILRRRVIGLT
ncbi:MAG: U32 family peptidase [Actinomycetota bacterium]|nr:U32 family peptidase [Actinomycetota bacterium]